MLRMTTGDSHAPTTGVNVSQQTDNLLGKVIRIDPTSDDFARSTRRNYAIPDDNPDFGKGAAPELWAIGLRNPYSASFDAATGRLFLPDVGEQRIEEINIGEAGANYGWSAFEGDLVYEGALNTIGALTDPLWQYEHGDDTLEGYSVTGGDVYRGVLDALSGQYVFADFQPGADGPSIWSFDAEADTVTGEDIIGWDVISPDRELGKIIGFGTDSKGRLYISDFNGGLFLVTDASLDDALTPQLASSAPFSILAAPTPAPSPAGIALLLSAVGVLAGLRVGARA